jgi:hypothetical protein
MGEFFKAGERYRNRIGEYEVIEVKTPMLHIRYVENGRLQDVEEELQERIVRNLQREIDIANKPPEAKRVSERPKAPRRKRAKYEGFQAEDFLDKTTGGSNWRTKAGLAGWLAESLAERCGAEFDSWAPQRQTTVYVTTPDQCGSEHLSDSVQYFVSTTGAGATYGLLVRRPADTAEGMSAWDRLLSTLSDDESLAASLNDLLTNGSAELSWYGDTWGPGERETVRGDETGLTFDRGNATEMDSMDGLIERLQDAPQDQSVTLTVESGLSVNDAIAAGAGVADQLLELMVSLNGLFGACAG